MPSWQNGIGVPPSLNPDNRQGRGIPDIAGNADPHSGYYLVFDGQQTVHSIGGTSAAAPLYAGLVALLHSNLGRKIGLLG